MFKRTQSSHERLTAVVVALHLGIPQLASLVEGTGDDLVPPGIVERDRVHHVAVPVQSQQLVPGSGVPHLVVGCFMTASRTVVRAPGGC